MTTAEEQNKAPPHNDGGPAFPQTDFHKMGDFALANVEGGMSLRDWFAGQALAGEIGSLSTEISADALAEAAVEAGRSVEDQIAFNCFSIADAMLKARGYASGGIIAAGNPRTVGETPSEFTVKKDAQ